MKNERKYLAIPIECDSRWEPSHLLDVPTGANFEEGSIGDFVSTSITRDSLFQTLSEAMDEVARQNAEYLKDEGQRQSITHREWNVVAEIGEPTEYFFSGDNVWAGGGKLSCHSEYPITIVTFSPRQGAKYGSIDKVGV
jgi:hypothetical protein